MSRHATVDLECDSCGRILLRGCRPDQAADQEDALEFRAILDGWWVRKAIIPCQGERDYCPACVAGLTPGPSAELWEDKYRSIPRGFTLVELLVVLAIVGIVGAVAVPAALGWSRTRAVVSAAREVHAAVAAARDAALRDRSPRGLRIVPGESWGLSRKPDGRIDGSKALAGVRIAPMAAGPAYSSGLATVDVGPLPAGFAKPTAVLMVEQSVVDRDGLLAEPTSWEWNVRVGDRIRIGGIQADYWVVGPEFDGPAEGNVDRFVNYGAGGPTLDRGDGRGKREYLWLVNGRDDDGDGRVDPGFNGVDDDVDGVVDSPGEWVEVEEWAFGHRDGVAAESYAIFRRPIPTSGPTVELEAAVIDLTGWGSASPPRSRAMVDPWTGAVDLIVEADGTVRPALVAGSPAALGLRGDWIHLWIADRSDVGGAPTPAGAARLVSIQGRTGRIVVGEIDPEDPTAAFAAAEGR